LIDVIIIIKIDCSTSTSDMQWSDIKDIKQLDCLTRAHIVLAQMSPNGRSIQKDHLLKAYYSAYRIIYQAVENAMQSLKAIQKIATQNEQASNLKKKITTNAAEKANAKTSTTQKKLKIDSGASTYLPQTIEQWSQFDFHEEIVSAWSHELMRENGINEHTIAEPYLLFYYLEQLSLMLNEHGLSYLLFVIYNLQLALLNCAIKYKPNTQSCSTLFSYVKFKLIELCVQLNLSQSIGFHQQSLIKLTLIRQNQIGLAQTNDQLTAQIENLNELFQINQTLLLKLLKPDANEMCLLRETIYEHRQELHETENQQDSLKLNVQQVSDLDSKKENCDNKHKKRTLLKINDLTEKHNVIIENNLPGEQRVLTKNLNEIIYKDAWLLIAEQLVQCGFFQIARNFIYEAMNASKVNCYLNPMFIYL
jgi:hypothetical protein